MNLGDYMHNLTFLTESQIFDSNGSDYLKIFNKVGTQAELTDFSVLLGAFIADRNDAQDRYGYYWTKTPDGTGDARAVSRIGYIYDT